MGQDRQSKEFNQEPPQKSPEPVSAAEDYFDKLRRQFSSTTKNSSQHIDLENLEERPNTVPDVISYQEPIDGQENQEISIPLDDTDEYYPQQVIKDSRSASPPDDYPVPEPDNPADPSPDPYNPEPMPEMQDSAPSIEEPDVLEVNSSLTEQFAQAIATTPIVPSAQLLITQISDCYTTAKRLMRKKKYEEAQHQYTEMLRHYHEIKKHKIPEIHKHIAHHGLEELYEELKLHQEHSTMNSTSFAVMVVATVLVLLVGITLVVNPSISGLAILEQSLPDYTGPSQIEVYGPRKVDLSTSFGITPEQLTLLSTRSEHIDVEVDHHSLIIVPEPGFLGEETISVIGVNTASEPYRMSKVPIRLIVR